MLRLPREFRSVYSFLRLASLDSSCGCVIKERGPQSTYRRREVAEREATPYCLAAKFPGERAAGRVYFQIQKLIDSPEVDLSAYPSSDSRRVARGCRG
jgi:hypothetical protein